MCLSETTIQACGSGMVGMCPQSQCLGLEAALRHPDASTGSHGSASRPQALA